MAATDHDGLCVRELTAAEVGEYVRRAAEAKGDEVGVLAWLAAVAACDADGAALFAGSDADDLAATLPLRTLQAISEAVVEVSGLGESAPKKRRG